MSFSGGFGGKYGGSFAGKPAIRPNPIALDHGLPRPLRTIVRESCIDALSRLHFTQGGYLQALEPTSAIINTNDRDGGEQNLGLAIAQLQGRFPAILVAINEKDYQPAGMSNAMKEWTGAMSVRVYFFGASWLSRYGRLAGDAEAAVSTTVDPGMDLMLEHGEQLLIGIAPGNTKGSIREMRPQHERLVCADAEIEVWEQVYNCVVTRSIKTKRDLDVELRQINTYHRLEQQSAGDTPIVSQETDIEP